MIRRYDILAKSGRYDGWAHNPDEMTTKFIEQFPDEPHPFIFSAGCAPQSLDYDAYVRALNRGLTREQIEMVDFLVTSDIKEVNGDEDTQHDA